MFADRLCKLQILKYILFSAFKTKLPTKQVLICMNTGPELIYELHKNVFPDAYYLFNFCVKSMRKLDAFLKSWQKMDGMDEYNLI